MSDRRASAAQTESGLPLEPVYVADGTPEWPPPGEFPFTRGVRADGYRKRLWTMRQYAGFGSAAQTNERFRYLLAAGQTGLSCAFDLPTQMGYDSDDPKARGEVGKVGVAIDSLDDMATLMDGIPQDEVTTSMTINAPASLLLLLYELVAESKGIDASRARRHHPERHPQGVRGPRHVHLPAAAVDAAGHRHLRVLRAAAAALEHHQHQRLPHPRGGRDRAAGDRVHPVQRHRLRAGRHRRRAGGRRLRAAAQLLLQRQQRLLRGGRQVPRRSHHLGGGDARALRRPRPAQPGAALPRPDQRGHAHRAAADQQRRARRHPGARRRVRRHAVAAHQQLRRGAGAALGAGRGDRAAHPAGDRLRVRRRARSPTRWAARTSWSGSPPTSSRPHAR